MHEKARYLSWVGIIAAVMAVFSLAILLIGYQDPSIGRVMTVIVLAAASAICFFLAWRFRPGNRGSGDGRGEG